MYNNNRRHYSHSHDNRGERHERREHATKPQKYSRGVILLKSTVFALFIVFVVLLAAFEIIKNRKESTGVAFASKCDKIKTISMPQNIESLSVKDGVITVLTKANKGEQEIIRFSADCGQELSRIVFKAS